MEGPGGEKNYKTGSAQFLSTLAFIQINLHEKEERCKVVIQQALPMQAHIFLQESHKAKWAFMNYFSTCIMLTTISKCLGIRAPKLGFWPPSSPYEQWLPCKQRHSFSAAEKVHFPRDSSSSLHPPGFTPPPLPCPKHPDPPPDTKAKVKKKEWSSSVYKAIPWMPLPQHSQAKHAAPVAPHLFFATVSLKVSSHWPYLFFPFSHFPVFLLHCVGRRQLPAGSRLSASLSNHLFVELLSLHPVV